ncbi:GSCFA domain-containing protein [Rhodobacter sp. NSM]|uniref:GSCFA domain-containing protein n=1 Tax=Rhodobacter sp. NSM TaxID=3457501 RepID=UPI003FD4904D
MKHPYIGKPDMQFWKKEPGIDEPSRLDPVTEPPFRIDKGDRLVTAGSCFAQHVAGHMAAAGFNHFITERAHPAIRPAVAKRHNYGMFSARYGNIYTARQMRQLLERAYGIFSPSVTSWPLPDGEGVVDPFRPQIQPGGFLSDQELEVERAQHFRCIRAAIEQMDVFVFTLGLTEAWSDRRDGAVYPLAPGVAGGIYDANAVEFINFDEEQTYADLSSSLSFIRSVNPNVKIILTVSPVPLNATYEPRHVLVSTSYSKAVLRIAAEKATREFTDCVYFPSYEIITSPHVRGRYFAQDCREVTQEGVSHVMHLFRKHFAQDPSIAFQDENSEVSPDRSGDAEHLAKMEAAIEIICDEESIRNA